MKRKITGFIIALLTAMMSVSAISPKQVYAAASGTAKVSAGAASVIAGETVTINVDINANMEMYVAQLELVYDNDLFEFVSTTGTTRMASSPAGVIPYGLDTPLDAAGHYPKSISFSAVFKAKAVGTGSFSIMNQQFAGMDGDVDIEIAMTCSAASVQVMAVGSDDATLGSLQVAGAALSPDFAKWTMNYTCYVDHSVTAVNIAAVASQGGKVEVGGNFNNLAVGGNNVTITSYAPNGKTMTYTINVVRHEPPTEPPATEAPTTTEPETTLAPIEDSVTVGGIKYTIDSGYSSDVIPAGFDAAVVSYKGNDVLAAVNAKYNATLFYLVKDDGAGSFFLYDSKNQSFFPYTVVDSGVRKYILADSANADQKPSGCTVGPITVNETTFEAFVSDDNGDFAYFYAISDKGVPGWYCYDRQENTVQRMYTVDMSDTPEPTSPDDQTKDSDGQTETEDGRLGSLENANNDLRKDYSELQKTRNLIIAIASVLLVVMLVIIVVMAAHKSEKKRAIDIDVDDLADEEDAIDRADVELAAVGETVGEVAKAVKESGGSDEEPEEIKPEEETPAPSGETESAETVEAAEETPAPSEEPESVETAESAEETSAQPEEIKFAEETPAPSEEIKSAEETPALSEITEADIEAFERETAAITEELAADISDVFEEENREIEPEIIDLAEDGGETGEAFEEPDGNDGETEDGIEIIDADSEREDDFFL